jgi:hypothetical protein
MATKKKPTRVKEEVITNNSDKHQEDLTNRLKHYNEWLMDNNRPIPSVYPGYPDDFKAENNKRKKSTVSTLIPTTPTTRQTVMKRTKTGTKQVEATNIVRKIGVDRKEECIKTIVSQLSMTLTGATTYFYNARREING